MRESSQELEKTAGSRPRGKSEKHDEVSEEKLKEEKFIVGKSVLARKKQVNEDTTFKFLYSPSLHLP